MLCQKCQEDWRGTSGYPCVCKEIDDPKAFVVILSDMGDSVVAGIYSPSAEKALEWVIAEAKKRWDFEPFGEPTVSRANAHGRVTAAVWCNARQYEDNIYMSRGY